MSGNLAGPDGGQQPTRVRNLILALACGISFVLYLHRYVWGFIKEDVRLEFGWDSVELGQLDVVFTTSYGAGQIPSGMICDWFGARFLLGGSVLFWSLALLGSAVATGFASMAMARFGLGVAQASGYPVLTKVSKNWFPLSMRTTAQGLIATFFGRAGGAAAFFLFGTGLIGGLGLSWRAAIAVFAAIGMVCGVLFLLLFRNSPREHPWSNQAEVDLIAAGDPDAVVAKHSMLNWTAMLGSVSVWFLLARATLANMADMVYVYWVPQYLRQLWGLNEATTGWLAALPLLGGALGGLWSGALQSWIIRRTGDRRLARSAVGGGGKLLAAALMLVSLALPSAGLIALGFLAVKFFSDMEQPAEWGAVSDISGGNAATLFACTNTFGAIGGTLGSLMIGSLLKSVSSSGVPTHAGWNAVFALTAVEYLLGAGCWLFIDCRKPLAARA